MEAEPRALGAEGDRGRSALPPADEETACPHESGGPRKKPARWLSGKATRVVGRLAVLRHDHRLSSARACVPAPPKPREAVAAGNEALIGARMRPASLNSRR